MIRTLDDIRSDEGAGGKGGKGKGYHPRYGRGGGGGRGCAIGCGRDAAHYLGFGECCLRCAQSGGASHDDTCGIPPAAAADATCAGGCDRPAVAGFPTCCRTCYWSGGREHGPGCNDARKEQAMIYFTPLERAPTLQRAVTYSGWPSLPPEEEGELAALVPCQAAALRRMRDRCRIMHNEAVPALTARCMKLGFSEEDLVKTLGYIREEAPLIMHVNLRKYIEKLASDTHYRNQFETGSSGGLLSTLARADWESILFGGYYDDQSLFSYSWEQHLELPLPDKLQSVRVSNDVHEEDWQLRAVIIDNRGVKIQLPQNGVPALAEDQFPVEAKLETSPFHRVKYGVLNVTRDPEGLCTCAQYGLSYIVLRHVRARVSMSSEDSGILASSMDPIKVARGLASVDYYAQVLNSYSDEELEATLRVGSGRAEWISSNVMQKKTECHFKEVQFHGELRFADHVAEIHWHPWDLWDSKLQPALNRFSELCGGAPLIQIPLPNHYPVRIEAQLRAAAEFEDEMRKSRDHEDALRDSLAMGGTAGEMEYLREAILDQMDRMAELAAQKGSGKGLSSKGKWHLCSVGGGEKLSTDKPIGAEVLGKHELQQRLRSVDVTKPTTKLAVKLLDGKRVQLEVNNDFTIAQLRALLEHSHPGAFDIGKPYHIAEPPPPMPVTKFTDLNRTLEELGLARRGSCLDCRPA